MDSKNNTEDKKNILELILKQIDSLNCTNLEGKIFKIKAEFTNINGVFFEEIILGYNRETKIYTISTNPCKIQDSINRNVNQKIISFNNLDLKLSFTELLEHIKKVYMCKECSNFGITSDITDIKEICMGCSIQSYLNLDKKNIEKCTICLENILIDYKTRCGHIFHKKCLVKLGPMPKCPLCRKFLFDEDTITHNLRNN